jgi:DNA polymerase-3 subunit alpha
VDDRRRLTPDNYLKSAAEMSALFADLPEAIENTVEIARRCSYYPQKRKPILPCSPLARRRVPIRPGGGRGTAQAGARGLVERIATLGLTEGYTREQYEERLEFELGVIERMKFPGYFLIVADFIKWAKAHQIPVGPGRGSGAGSLVAYALTITDIDPLRFSCCSSAS